MGVTYASGHSRQAAVSNRQATVRLYLSDGRSGEFTEKRRRAGRASHQTPATVRAFALQRVLGAVCAERAFERTDARVDARRIEVLVAAFAVRAHLKHVASLSALRAATISSPDKEATKTDVLLRALSPVRPNG